MRAVVIGVLAVLAGGCRDPCDNESFKEFKSPSGKWKVVVFEPSCGATTDFSTQASLFRADEPTPKKAGNLLAIDSNHGAVAVDSNSVAVAHGNRTHRTCLSARATGFEDRAGHQIRTRYRPRI